MPTSFPIPATPLHAEPPPRPAVRRTAARPAGDWHYSSGGRSRLVLGLAAAVSAAFHLGVLFGWPKARPPVPKAAVPTLQLTITMPLLKELEEPERPPADDDAKPDLGQPVPMQADVPSLALPTDFVQQFDFASLVPQPDLSDMKMLTLPENIRRSGKLMDGVKIFDLSSLDRIPEAVVQTPPVYPMALRGEGPTATVTVLFIVGIDGRVSNARAVDSTDIRFNEAAVIGVSKWRFHAGIKDSRRVVTRMIVPITFSIVAAGEYAH